MISLGDNVSMPYAKWDAALGMPTASRFTKLITRGIYTPLKFQKDLLREILLVKHPMV